MRRLKYGNSKTCDGFDSRKEARRYQELLIMERAGQIRDLQRQVHFELTPTIREPDIIGPRGGRKPGKVIEHKSEYIADFTYYRADGSFVVEDCKGFRTKDYILKRKVMLHLKGIRIYET